MWWALRPTTVAAPAPAVAPVVVAAAPGAAANAAARAVVASLFWMKVWMVTKWLLVVALAVALVAAIWLLILPQFGPISLPSGMEWTDDYKDWWEKTLWLVPWKTVVGALGAAMLLAALLIVVSAVFGKVGWERALRLAAILVLGGLLVVYHAVVFKTLAGVYDSVVLSYSTMPPTTFLILVLILAGLFALTLGDNPLWVRRARLVLLALLLVVLTPSLVQWVNNNTARCIGSEETCARVRALHAVREAELVHAKQLAIEKAKIDATRRVTPGCPGNVQVIALRPEVTSHINLNKCALQFEVLEGKVVFTDWTGLTTSKAVGPGEPITLEFVISGAYAAPGTHARLKYSPCAGHTSEPLDYECRPRQQIARRP